MGATKPASARNTPSVKQEVKRTGKVPVAVVGATGYAGRVVRLLSAHTGVELTVLTSEQYQGRLLADVYPFLRGSVSHTVVSSAPAEGHSAPSSKNNPTSPNMILAVQAASTGSSAPL